MDIYDEITRVAHELWEKRGGEHGSDLDDWHQAEIIVRARYEQLQAAGKTEKKPAKPKKAVPKKTPEKSTKGPAKKKKPTSASKK